MRYVTTDGKTLDARDEENISKNIFTFSFKSCDYMLRYHITWNIVITEYTFKIGNGRIQLPSGVYLFCGDGDGAFDWIGSDEIINRDVYVFQMSSDFRDWKLSPIKLEREQETRIYMPQTTDIIPVADTSNYFSYMAYSDPMRKYKNIDFLNSFVI